LLDPGEIAQIIQTMITEIEAQGGPPESAAVVDLMIEAFGRPVAGEQARARLGLGRIKGRIGHQPAGVAAICRSCSRGSPAVEMAISRSYSIVFGEIGVNVLSVATVAIDGWISSSQIRRHD
jgi:hypothetical protein